MVGAGPFRSRGNSRDRLSDIKEYASLFLRSVGLLVRIRALTFEDEEVVLAREGEHLLSALLGRCRSCGVPAVLHIGYEFWPASYQR